MTAQQQRHILAAVLSLAIFGAETFWPSPLPIGTLYTIPALIALTLPQATLGPLLFSLLLLPFLSLAYRHTVGTLLEHSIATSALSVLPVCAIAILGLRPRSEADRPSTFGPTHSGTFLSPGIDNEDRVLLDGLMDAIPDHIYYKDRDGRYLRINKAKASRSGLASPDDAIGMTDFNFFQPEHARAALMAEQEIIRTGQSQVDREQKLLWPDGRVSWVSATKVPLRNRAGEIIGTLGISRDVTRQHEAEGMLQHERDRLRTLIDALPDNIFIKDTNFRFVTVNQTHIRSFRCQDESEIVGRDDFSFCPPELARAYREDDSLVLAGDTLLNREEKFRAALGEDRWILTTKVPLRTSSGEITGLVGICRDITDRKQFEEELRRAKEAAEVANRTKSEFLANMSHEIRTPMNAVLGMTELVLGTTLDSRQRDYLQTAQQSAESLMDILNDILDFSKIEAGRVELESYAFDFREWLGDVLKTMSVRAHAKKLELACRVAPDIPKVMLGDGLRLRQIVLNLVGNAIKFTEAGEVVLTVDLIQEREDKVELHFRVRDTGIGISAAHQQRIFKAFEQADTSMTRRFGGTGLGLAISASLVQLMGGSIWVESHVGQGSIFNFTATLARGDDALSVTRTTPRAVIGLKVLIVDDNETNRVILEEMCRNWGMIPTAVPDANAAIEALQVSAARCEPFPIVLTDASMPDVDGFTLVEHIRQQPAIASTIIMMLTSIDERPEISREKSLAIRSYLVKPIKQSDLFDAVVSAFDEQPQPVGPGSGVDELGRIPPLRILLVEDSLPNQKLAVGLLSRFGHTLEVAVNGQEACEKATSEEYDLVLMDVQMPVLNGLEATQLIRKWEEGRGRHVPIVAMTAHAMKGDRDLCLQAGMDGYVTKPVRPLELAEALVNVLNIDQRSGPTSAAMSVEREASSDRTPSASAPLTLNAQPSTLNPLSNGVPVNWDAALKSMLNDENLLREVIAVFLGDVGNLVRELKESLERQSAADCRRIAHTLKGNLKTFQACGMETAMAMETAASQGDLPRVAGLVGQLEGDLDRTTTAMRERLG